MGTSKKILQNKDKTKVQALHKRFTPPPPLLEKFIRLVNWLPPDIEPPRVEVAHTFEKYEEWVEWRVLQYDLLSDFLKHCPKELKRYIGLPKWSGGRIDEENLHLRLNGAIYTFRNLVHIRITLMTIIFEREFFASRYFSLTYSPAGITIDSNNKIKVLQDDFVRAIDGVDADRIKCCPVCSLIFWAGRITQQCCSPRCSNIFRVRRHRYRTDEEKAEIKAKRILGKE